MKKKFWLIFAGIVLALIALAALGAGGAYFYWIQRNKTWLQEAETAYAKGQWLTAKGYLERYLPQDPKNADLLTKYADACMRVTEDRASALQGASTAYQQILTYQSDNQDIRKRLVDLYVKLSAWSTLEYYTADWLRNQPDDERLQYYHALALDHTGNKDKALAEYELLVANKTERSDVYGSYARLLREKGLESKAEEVFRSARAARPNDGHILVDYARFLARKSTWPEVQHLLDQALAMSPDDPDVLVATAQAAMLRRQTSQAIDLLKKAIQVKPDEGPAYLMLASAYVNQNMPEEAVKLLKGADPFVQADSPMMLITLADLQLGLGAFDDAKKTIELYDSVYPDQLATKEYFAAKELLVRGEPTAAVKRLSSVVQLRPNFILAQYTMAEAYLASGETELARSTLENYLSKNSSDERAQRLMAQRFGRPMSLETLSARAEDANVNKEMDPQRLTTMAAALLDAAVQRDVVQDQAEKIIRLLQRAREADPKLTRPYGVAADLALWQHDAGAAAKAIDDAVAAGNQESDFELLRVVIALEQGDTAAADTLTQAATARAGFDSSQYSQWAAYLAQHGYYDRAQAILEFGSSHLDAAEAKASLAVDRAVLALRKGNTANVAEWLEAARPSIAPGTSLRRRFNAARLQLAQWYLTQDDSHDAEQRARTLLTAVREEDPGNPSLQVVDGFLLMRKQPPDYDGAQASFERAAAADALNGGAQWGLAKVAIARDDYPRALTAIERAVYIAPDVPALQLLQAEAMLKTDRLYEAEKVLNRILARTPENAYALELLTRCFIARGKTKDAQAAMAGFEKAAGDNPQFAPSLASLRITMMASSENPAKAEAALQAEFNTRPDDAALASSLATVIMQQGRAEDAKNILTSFAESHANKADAWVTVAEWWGESNSENKWKEASTALTRALLADPNYIPAIRGMLSIRLRQGDTLEALGLCDRYLLRNPDDADMLNTRAILLSQNNGRLNEALAAANRAVELDDRPDFKGTRGIVLVAMKQYSRALRDLQPAVSGLGETNARIDTALAEAYLATNELKLARQYLDAALSKSTSGDPADQERLRGIKVALEKKESAA